MKLIVGLGNPGKKYALTRHNLGFVVIDHLAGGQKAMWLKPQTGMNLSGEEVARVSNYHQIDPADILVIHDDLDLKLGSLKLQKGTGPKDHNGLLNIEEKLGTKDFWRLRVGIDNRDPHNRTPGEIYTLENFTPAEKLIVESKFKEIKSLVTKFIQFTQ